MSFAIAERSAVATFDDVMSCAGRVVVVGGSGSDPNRLAAEAGDRLRQLERRWSRFLPTSDVTRLNTASGRPVEVSDDTVTLAEHLVEAHALTGGSFDPTLLRPLVELGYATSRTRPGYDTDLSDTVAVRGRIDRAHIDPERHEITLPCGTAVDAGGIGKGLAADIVSAETLVAGAQGCLVEVGGDLRVRGLAPNGHAWTIDLAGHRDEPPLVLASGGVATSSSQLRTWQRGDQTRHHLLDPTTLLPSARGVVECTVAVGSAAIAEALTKVAFVRGLHEGIGFYADRGIAARVVDADGSIVSTPAWRELRGDVR